MTPTLRTGQGGGPAVPCWLYARDVPLGGLEHLVADLGACPLTMDTSTVVGSLASDAT